jgi:hypothetical protein
MTIELYRHQLECLGWKVLKEDGQPDGAYHILAQSCNDFILAFANTSDEAWSAACSMAMRLTRDGTDHPPTP